MNLLFLKLRRLLRRVLWKVKRVSDSEIESFLNDYYIQEKYPEVRSIDETVKKIVDDKCSIARFGDGELCLCMGRAIAFQQADKTLAKKLNTILKTGSTDKCLITIPEFRIIDVTPFWKRFWYENIQDITNFLKQGEIYYNTNVTREGNVLQIQLLKKAWEGRNVIFVLGKGGRFNVEHELFDNITSRQIIYGDAKNAWKDYAMLVSEVRQKAALVDKALIICALGPTATVLAADIGNNGIQTLDVGHLTNVYDSLVYGKKKPEDI